MVSLNDPLMPSTRCEVRVQSAEPKDLPPKCSAVDKHNAFRGGFRWMGTSQPAAFADHGSHSEKPEFAKGQRKWQHAHKQSLRAQLSNARPGRTSESTIKK